MYFLKLHSCQKIRLFSIPSLLSVPFSESYPSIVNLFVLQAKPPSKAWLKMEPRFLCQREEKMYCISEYFHPFPQNR